MSALILPIAFLIIALFIKMCFDFHERKTFLRSNVCRVRNSEESKIRKRIYLK
jgi:hypothetical protein